MTRSLFRPRPATAKVVRNAVEPELLLYDEIGMFGIRAADFVKELKATAATTIHLRINSPGGDVPDGVAIYNAVKAHPARVVVHVDALAASIASLIALAGDEVRIADNAFLMIHNAWGLTVGNATDHRDMADLLEKVDDATLVRTYAARTGLDAAEVRRLMAEETWFTAEEAVEVGLADAIDTPVGVSAGFDLSVFRHAPAALRETPDQPPTTRTLERALRDAGLSRTAAKAVLADGVKALEHRTTDPTTLLRDAERAELMESSQRLLSTLRAGVAGACPTT